MLLENKDLFDALGITKWHNAGITGKGVVVASGEPFSIATATAKGYKAIAAIPSHDTFFYHGIQTALTCWAGAPDITIVSMPHDDHAIINGTPFNFNVEGIEMIKKYGVSMMFLSKPDGTEDMPARDAALDQVPNFMYLTSIGNDSTVKYNQLADCKNIYGVGACKLIDGKFVPADYSSVSASIDVSAPAGVFSMPFDQAYPFDGTSCSGPLLVGMLGLIDELAIRKTGHTLSRVEKYRLIKTYAVDLADVGFDTKTGYGVFIMPDIDTFDVTQFTTPAQPRNLQCDPWATPAMNFCIDAGIFKGDGHGNYGGKDVVTKQILAQMLYNIRDRLGY